MIGQEQCHMTIERCECSVIASTLILGVFCHLMMLFFQSRSKTEDPQQLRLKEKAKAVS